MTSPAPWNETDGFAYVTPPTSNTLPVWARTFRNVLMVLGGVGVAALIGIYVSFAARQACTSPEGFAELALASCCRFSTRSDRSPI